MIVKFYYILLLFYIEGFSMGPDPHKQFELLFAHQFNKLIILSRSLYFSQIIIIFLFNQALLA